jgi:hypothetical protein
MRNCGKRWGRLNEDDEGYSGEEDDEKEDDDEGDATDEKDDGEDEVVREQTKTALVSSIVLAYEVFSTSNRLL